MRKFTILMLSILIAGASFAQFSTKTETRNGKTSPRKINKSTNLVVPQVNQQTNFSSPKNVLVNYFSEGFEGADITTTGWSTIDQDGDGYDWAIGTSGFHTGLQYATSASWDGTVGPLTPENWLISPAIDLTTASGTLFLDWWVRAQDQAWPSEHYKVMVSTTGTAIANFTANLYEETVVVSPPGNPAINNKYVNRTANVSAYVGQTIYIAFVHYNCTDMFMLNIDDVNINSISTTDAGIIGFVSPDNTLGCQLTSTEDVTVQIFNYGGTTISNFPVSYSVNGGAVVTANCAQSIAPAATYDFTFPVSIDMSTLNTYDFNAYTTVPGDATPSNNAFDYSTVSADAFITIETHTDSASGQDWNIVNSLTGDTVATHGPYQWGLTFSDDICVFADQCYTVNFNDPDGMSSLSYVVIKYNGTIVGGSTTPGSFNQSLHIINVGGGCAGTDGGVSSMVIPYGCQLGTEPIQAYVFNYGTLDISNFDVSYVFDGGAAVTQTVTSTIPSGDSLLVIFTTLADFSAAGPHTVSAYTTISGDANSANDGVGYQTTTISSSVTPYTCGFDSNAELLGWSLEDVNADGSGWGIFAPADAISTPNVAGYSYSAINAADDYLFTTCIDFTATDYILDFQYKIYDVTYPERMEVKIGTSATSASMTTTIVPSMDMISDVWALSHSTFTITTPGTYYIGFHAISDANMWDLYIEDVLVDFASGINKNTKNYSVNIYPNPTTGIVTITNAENSTVNVYNMLGQVVYSSSIVSAKNTLDLSKLADGSYFVKVMSDKNVYTQKINLVK